MILVHFSSIRLKIGKYKEKNRATLEGKNKLSEKTELLDTQQTCSGQQS
jgi:hypothetical protein